jgi:chaperonin GroES
MSKGWNKFEKEAGIRAAGCHVLVKPDNVEEVSEGGIILAHETIANKKGTMVRGTLISIGPAAFYRLGEDDPFYKPGDKVDYVLYGGVNTKGKNGEEYRYLNDEDLFGVIDDE